MKYLTKLTALLSSVLCLQADVHIPWILEGANERIAKHRMGDIQLRLRLPEGCSVPVDADFKLVQTDHDFQFGGSLAADWEVPKKKWYPNFKKQFADLFNYATIDFYWAVHEKKPRNWQYNQDSREKLNWAKEQGMRLRGHPLMWHEVMPDFMTDFNRDISEIDADVMHHIRRLLEGYPEIDEWDVYNEAIGIKWRDKREGVRRWFESIGGPAQVSEKMLRVARSIRPDARYILNHYTDLDVEYEEQIEHCLNSGVNVEVIGLQTHMLTEMDSINESRLWNALETYSRFNKPLHLSEISIPSCERFTDWESYNAWKDKVEAFDARGDPRPIIPSTPKMEQYQADLARDFYTLAFSHPSVEAIIWWSITDLEPWRGMPAGLIDTQGAPKPVYEVLDQLINYEWRTHLSGKITEDSVLQVRGFYGSYSLSITHGDQEYVADFWLSRSISEPIEISLKLK